MPYYPPGKYPLEWNYLPLPLGPKPDPGRKKNKRYARGRRQQKLNGKQARGVAGLPSKNAATSMDYVYLLLNMVERELVEYVYQTLEPSQFTNDIDLNSVVGFILENL